MPVGLCLRPLPIGAHRVYATRQFDHVLANCVGRDWRRHRHSRYGKGKGEVITVDPDGRDAGKLIPSDIEPGDRVPFGPVPK
jgi:hypothetical protein